MLAEDACDQLRRWQANAGVELWFADECGVEGDPRPAAKNVHRILCRRSRPSSLPIPSRWNVRAMLNVLRRPETLKELVHGRQVLV